MVEDRPIFKALRLCVAFWQGLESSSNSKFLSNARFAACNSTMNIGSDCITPRPIDFL
jgi:hypothetical protein